jgi:hypothetical protein
MPLICDALSATTVSALNRRIAKLPTSHPLHKECLDGTVTAFKQNDVLVLHSAGGFYFEHMKTPDLETELGSHIRCTREYHCTTFEVDADDPSVVEKLLDRFQEQHGVKMRAMIDWCVITFQGKQLMLCKLPACILRHMLAPTGGLMKTVYAGPIDSLKQVPTLAKLGILSNDFVVDGSVRSVLATEYKDYHYYAVNRLHWDVVREVIARPHLGITLGPVAQWDA